jgi:hypothetical protein
LTIEDIAFENRNVWDICEGTIIDLRKIKHMNPMPVIDQRMDDKSAQFSGTPRHENPHP